MKFFIIYFLSVNFVEYLLKKNLTAENCVRVPRTFVACFQAFAKVLITYRYKKEFFNPYRPYPQL